MPIDSIYFNFDLTLKFTKLLPSAGAASVDVAVTHALFAGDALALIIAAGVNRVWSTDCIAHASNAISMAPLLAQALKPLLF
ncbi:hypothetical protein [Rheinheimera baltica]|uniref:hypothetical protein n=1 Tax=Rheinheimera baltica TaxID=67576 RepID=UPI002740197C|nr:hypothetical protein [Rheinheimera baltica]MDP5190848.1 hypothetical protein [Rheinheimera baltica]